MQHYVLQTIKIDINIEKDLAYALNVKACPELLFLKGNKILYREKGQRCSNIKSLSKYELPFLPDS